MNVVLAPCRLRSRDSIQLRPLLAYLEMKMILVHSNLWRSELLRAVMAKELVSLVLRMMEVSCIVDANRGKLIPLPSELSLHLQMIWTTMQKPCQCRGVLEVLSHSHSWIWRLLRSSTTLIPLVPIISIIKRSRSTRQHLPPWEWHVSCQALSLYLRPRKPTSSSLTQVPKCRSSPTLTDVQSMPLSRRNLISSILPCLRQPAKI